MTRGLLLYGILPLLLKVSFGERLCFVPSYSTPAATTSLTHQRSRRITSSSSSSPSPSLVLFAKAKRKKHSSSDTSKGPGNVIRPANEFSRVYRVDAILGSGARRRKDYMVEIIANDEEREALANRFELSKIDKLEANVALRQEGSMGGERRGGAVVGVEVDGTVTASVTQTCVRTGETFDVDLEFPLFAIARPVARLSLRADGLNDDYKNDFFDPELAAIQGYYDDADAADEEESVGTASKKRKRSVRAPERNINEMDILALQRLLQEADVEDSVVEDEGVYTLDGKLDVGELVAQLFWLKLDPLPKKPGTDPVRMSISG